MSDLPPGSMPPPPPPPPAAPPPAYTPPMSYQPPPGPGAPQQQSPGYMPPPIGPTAAVGSIALAQQFSGAAAWSIGLGVVGIVVPFVFNFYFPLLPIIGFLNAARAIQRGRLIGGLVGIAVNVVAGIVALLASGLIGG